MKDLIERQAAIDVVKGIDRSFVKYIEELPSAQLEERKESLCKKVRALCEESKIEFFFVGGGESTWSVTNDKHIKKIVECHKAQLSQEDTTKDATSDTISRQAVIEINRSYHGQMPNEVNHRIWKEINGLPSAQLDTYWKEQCQSYEQTINKLIESLSTQPEIIHCKECKFYTEMRQDLNTGICSLACRHLGGDGFCSEAERRTNE